MCLCLFESTVIFFDYILVTVLITFFPEVLVLFVCKCRAWFVYDLDGNAGLVYIGHFTKLMRPSLTCV